MRIARQGSGGRPPRETRAELLRAQRYCGIGLLLALGAGKILQGFLYGVDAVEPIVLLTAPLILLAASLLASYIPALRATKVDPTVALRSE